MGETAFEWLIALKAAGTMTLLKSASPAETSSALVPVFSGQIPHFQKSVPTDRSGLQNLHLTLQNEMHHHVSDRSSMCSSSCDVQLDTGQSQSVQ